MIRTIRAMTLLKKVLGKFKDEMDGKVITNFIALRPKMCCLRVFNEKKVEKKAKGVPKNTVKKDLGMKDYENTLHKHKPKNVDFNAIRSKDHQIYSINQSKVGLTSYDNKRFWMNDTEDCEALWACIIVYHFIVYL